tara:strand:- start:143 stop:310 length:168 start_codon:yes stop_codon:yes gene_type:complete
MSGENKIFNYISNRIVDSFDILISLKKEIKVHHKFRLERIANNQKIKDNGIFKKQ